MSEELEQHPGLVLYWIAYLADMKRTPKPFPVKAEEKKLLYPDVVMAASLEIMSLDQLAERFALEAIFRKEIVKTTSTRDITLLLLSVLYGSILSAHLSQTSPVKNYFRKNLESLLKGLQ
jgi:hypothetical protein